MNTNRELDQIVGDWLSDRTVEPARSGLDDAIRQLDVTPQRRRRFLGRWFDRDAGARRRPGEHDHPPDQNNRRNRLMFSATGAIAAIAVLAFTINVVNDPQRLSPQAGAGNTYSVAADGSGDYPTIAAAVAAAAAGDTILIGPGTHIVAKVVIDKDITLMGDGPREGVIVQVDADQSTWPADVVCGTSVDFDDGCAFLLDNTKATLSGLTFKGDWAGLAVIGGAPTLQDLVFDHVGSPFSSSLPGEGTPLWLLEGSRASVLDSEFLISGALDIFSGSAPLVEGNILSGGTQIYAQAPGEGTVIRNNQISGTFAHAIGVYAPTTMLIEGNTLSDAGTSGIEVGWESAAGVNPIIRDNTISGNETGINVVPGAAPAIEGNTFVDNTLGVRTFKSEARIRANDIRGEGIGISIGPGPGDASSIVDNIIDVSDIGVLVGGDASTTITGNSICGATASVRVITGAEPVLQDNELCTPAVLPE